MIKLESTVETAYRRKTPRSLAMFERVRGTIPGGMTQGSRYYPPYPIYVERAAGSHIWDVDGNEYTDYWLAATAVLLGHSHPRLVQAAAEQLSRGTNFGLPYELEAKAAEKIIQMIPCAESVKFTNSGMDACMLGVRVARVFTKRNDIIVFAGHFHGWEDQLYKGYAKAMGIPEEVQRHTIVVPFNSFEDVERVAMQDNVAAVILEPFSTNAGAIPPSLEFLRELRRLTSERGIVLIFDEVVTNLRLARGGAQEYFGVTPDLAALGKPLSGGFSAIGALVGRKDILALTDQMRPDYVYHGAWMAPLTMVAVLTTLELLKDGILIAHANRLGDRMRNGLNAVFGANHVEAQAIGIGSAVRVHFTSTAIRSPADLTGADRAKLASFHLGLVNRGHFVLPGRNCYTSVVHTDGEIDSFLEAAEAALKELSIH